MDNFNEFTTLDDGENEAGFEINEYPTAPTGVGEHQDLGEESLLTRFSELETRTHIAFAAELELQGELQTAYNALAGELVDNNLIYSKKTATKTLLES